MRKARSAAVLGAVGGGVGVTFGAFWSAVFGLSLWGGFSFATVGSAVFFWGLVGVLSGAGFGTLLAILGSRTSLERLPLWRTALLGALAGAALPSLFAVLSYGLGDVHVASFLATMSIVCGGVGSLLASSLVGLAKRAPDTLPGEAEAPDRLDRG